MTMQYWYMLPVSIAVATTAMASGVGGATFFSPIFLENCPCPIFGRGAFCAAVRKLSAKTSCVCAKRSAKTQ